MKNVDAKELGKGLMEVAHASETAYAVAEYFHDRFFNGEKQGRNRPFVDIRRTRMEMVREGRKVIEAEYTKYWKDLQALGVGSIVYGRRGNPDRFALHYSLKGLSQAMMDGTLDQETSTAVERQQRPKPSQVKPVRAKVEANGKRQKKTKSKVLCIPLREGVVEINLPSDITRDEIATLHTAIDRVSS